ncbi:MAG: hypothetical protein Q6351_006980 [Candidatus Njordarchaeum guaymaensis]
MEINSLIYIIARNFSEDSCAYFVSTKPSKKLRTLIPKLLSLYYKVEILNFLIIKKHKKSQKLLFYTIYLDGLPSGSAKVRIKTSEIWR